MKLSKCRVERCQSLLRWIYCLWTAQISVQLTTRYGRPCMSVFTICISTSLVNWNSGWFSSAIRSMTLSIQLLSSGVKGFKHISVQNAVISSSDVNKTKFLRPRPTYQDQDHCLQDQDQNNQTETTGSKQRHLVDLTFEQVNATVDLHSSDVPSTE